MVLTDDLPTRVYPAVFVLLSILYVVASMRRRRSGLYNIPTVGPSGILSSRLGALKTFFYGHQMILEGYKKYRIFKIRRYFSWFVIVNGHEYLEDIRKATDDQLSFLDALDLAAQLDHTISPGLRTNLFHINVVRGPMTRSIGARFPDILDEMNKAFGGLLGGAERDWVSVPCYSSVVHIVSRVSARFLVGPKLSSNPRYTDIMQRYTTHVAKTAVVIRLLPNWLKPIVARSLFDSEGKIHEVEDYLRPILRERLEKDTDIMVKDDSPKDMITWLWNAAPASHRNIRDIAIRMIFLNMTAIHTTCALLTHVLFNLAAYTSYIEPLREEISAVIKTEGWNKIAIEKIKDTVEKGVSWIRLSFGDGTFIPKGTNLAVSARAINQDERLYTNSLEFQGFRFAEEDPLKWQMTSLNEDYMTFGVGRHACPGRFFAIAEVKAVVAHILLDYDIKLTDEQNGRPKDLWFTGLFVAPNRKARISLKKRGV